MAGFAGLGSCGWGGVICKVFGYSMKDLWWKCLSMYYND